MTKKIIWLLVASFLGLIISDVSWGLIVVHNMIIANTISPILGGLIPLLTMIFLFKKNILTDTIFLEILFLVFLGFYVQQVTYATAPYYDVGIFNKYLGFTLFFPLFGILFHSFRIKKKLTIVFVSIFMAILIHIINFILYPIVGGHAEQMYGLILLFGCPIAILFGIIYAIYFIKFYT
jgi:hypothetical protein